MPVTYTITSGDVASVSGTSRLTAGVEFDWTNQKIYIPSGVAQVNAQFAIDNCRFAESLFKGSGRPQIIVGAGAVQIGVDPDTLAPIATPTIAIFQDEWRLVTEKTSGIFVVRDIYANLDASTPIPYDDVAGVFIQYLTSVTGAVATVSTGDGGFTSTDRTALTTLYNATTAGTGETAFSTAALANTSTAVTSALTTYTVPTLAQVEAAGFTTTRHNALIAADLAARALADGRYEIDYTLSTATQYDPDGTVRTVFDLQDADGNPATSGQTAVKRVPQ
jgi:hypothetical protein